MKNIDWIFFDVGGVLVDDQWAEDLRMKNIVKVLRHFDESISESMVWEKMPQASSMLGPMNYNIFEMFLKADKDKMDEARELVKPLWENSGYVEKIELRGDALSVVEKLSQHYKLGFMANQKAETRDRLDELGILKFFDHDLMSKHYELRKPNPEFFKSVLNDAQTTPERSAIIDDNIERALIPAKKLGMKTIWFDRGWRNDYPRKDIDHHIKNLRELEEIFL